MLESDELKLNNNQSEKTDKDSSSTENKPFTKQLFLYFILMGVLAIIATISIVKETPFTAEQLNKLLGLLLFLPVLAYGISFGLASRFSKPLITLKASLEKLVQGDLDHNIPILKEDHFQLTVLLNEAVRKLNKRFKSILKERQEKEVIVANMSEGVIALNKDENIVTINESAARLFGKSLTDCIGKRFSEIARNSELQEGIQKALESHQFIEKDVMIQTDLQDNTHQPEWHLQVHISTIKDQSDKIQGILMVLNDITRLKQLENMRKEFVANVSHELRTPITLIQGAVETLQDGAKDNPEDCAKFLKMMNTHALRLNNIIEDLLELSSIEIAEDAQGLEKKEEDITGIIQNVLSNCQTRIAKKGITIQFNPIRNVVVDCNAPLLEQAVTNLIENAIKYSEEKSAININLDQNTTDQTVSITVKDSGIGIEKHHLNHIFERFYRVDKARSRSQGGTGLGLSIVKHIALAHGGTVSVESELGEGSSFKMLLPNKISHLKDILITEVETGDLKQIQEVV